MRLLATTSHHNIRTIGILSKCSRNDKDQLRYNRTYFHHVNFYVGDLKVRVKSIRQFIGGTLYTKNIGFKKLFLWTEKTSEKTGHTLQNSIEIVGIPPDIHSSNHSNFKEGLFWKLLWKVDISTTYTEHRSPWQNWSELAIGKVKRHAWRPMKYT